MKPIALKTAKFTFRFLLVFIGLIVLYFLSAYILSRIPVDKEACDLQEVEVYIRTNGTHTDIVLPLHTPQLDWTKKVPFSATKITDTASFHFIAFGWGDKGFYLEAPPELTDVKIGTALNAAFGFSSGAVHTTFYKKLKESETCKRIMLSNEQYDRLLAYITNSFLTDPNGNFVRIHTTAVYGTKDAFYEGQGSYHLLHTCNTWANNGLKACGQKACLWTPFDTGIFHHYN
jgi:uncharacterized protein (TIGR02117 family)